MSSFVSSEYGIDLAYDTRNEIEHPSTLLFYSGEGFAFYKDSEGWYVIDTRQDSIVKKCLLDLKILRTVYGKSSSMGKACKLAMVSVYGAMGSSTSVFIVVPRQLT